jgi:hypothetical protein
VSEQRLSHDGLDPRGVITDLLPLVGVLTEQSHHLGEQLGGGLVAGHEQLLEDAEHLGQVEGPGVGRLVGLDARVVRERALQRLGAMS